MMARPGFAGYGEAAGPSGLVNSTWPVAAHPSATHQATVSDPLGPFAGGTGVRQARKQLRAFSLDNVTSLEDPTTR